jgi:hypothetical protein
MIPRRIIQIWSGPEPPPLLLQAAIANVKLFHPDFVHIVYDETMADEFVRHHFPEYLDVYRSFPVRIQKYDFFRYLAVYHLGGFYLDTDIFLVRSLTPLLALGAVFSFEELVIRPYLCEQFQMDWQIANYAFGAEAGHPFLAAVIDNCVRANRTTTWAKPMMKGIPRMVQPDAYIINTTGPGMLSRTYAENPGLAASVTILFPDDVCNLSSWHRFGTYGVHNMAGAWRPRRSLAHRLLLRLWKQWKLRRVLAEGRSRGEARKMPAKYALN